MSETPTSSGPLLESTWFVAVGASGAEGLVDIRNLLECLPATLPAVVLIVLHRPWTGVTHLREVLSRSSLLPVVIASDGAVLRPGFVYIGRPAEHLTVIEQAYAELVDDPDRQHGNRTVDLLFKTVASKAGGKIIGVVIADARSALEDRAMARELGLL